MTHSSLAAVNEPLGRKHYAVFARPGRIGPIDTSSWISWLCYGAGLKMVLTPQVIAEAARGSAGIVTLVCAIVAFFLAVILIQHHMRLSLLSSSFGDPRELITTGPFRYSRNPIYLAFLLPILSLAIYDAAVAAGTALGYVLMMTLVVIRREEAELALRFPAAFTAYRRRVPRWIGWRSFVRAAPRGWGAA
ncbi:MAG: isoprenylcysteine carboxylmethyltransferase family protein [Hyphomicrobiaceae bacterium]|nr:isoprenylcysteine carboxylmethyltransferase family protein [Hyphomicrobiaceae bacterium]